MALITDDFHPKGGYITLVGFFVAFALLNASAWGCGIVEEADDLCVAYLPSQLQPIFRAWGALARIVLLETNVHERLILLNKGTWAIHILEAVVVVYLTVRSGICTAKHILFLTLGTVLFGFTVSTVTPKVIATLRAQAEKRAA